MAAEDLQMQREQRMARGLRAAVMVNLLGSGNLTREEAEELLNAPLSPNEPRGPVFDDRKMLDWSQEQFNAFLMEGAE